MRAKDLVFTPPRPRGGRWVRHWDWQIDAQLRILDSVRFDLQSGCWMWRTPNVHDQYGRIEFRGCKGVLAHRLSYMAFVGPVESECVCHHCDTPSCVNPSHLYDGTHADNRRDSIERYGARYQKLNSEADKVIAWAKRRGMNLALLARLHGVDHKSIRAAAIRWDGRVKG